MRKRYAGYYDGTLDDDDSLDTELATETADGLMSKQDKALLNYLANNAVGGDGGLLEAKNIVTDKDHRFVSDEQIAKWNNIQSGSGDLITGDVATADSHGLMSKEDKVKLDKITTSETVEKSLLSTNWTTEQPYLQELEIDGIDADINLYIGINYLKASADQIKCATNSKIKVQNVDTNKIIITAQTKPQMDIPIMIIKNWSGIIV